MGKDIKGKGAIEIIEEAVHVLRLYPLSLLSSYYVGSLPFVLALLYFWADMSRSAFAAEYCLQASLGLAMLFVWMKCWHAVFSQKIRAYVNKEPAPRWSIIRMCRLVSTQSILQCTGIFVLPIALVMAIPFGWAYALYQNLSSQDDGSKDPIREVFNRSWHQALLWPGQNHIIILIISLFALFVFLNLAMTIYITPILLKKLLGIETVFSISGLKVLNTTFLAATCGLTYLCVDPLIKAIYTLRCFYGSSLKSGDDIRADLKGFARHGQGLAFVMIMLLCSAPFFTAIADEPPGEAIMANSMKRHVIIPNELDRSIEEIMSQREFIWRMPREKPEKEKDDKSLLTRFFKWMGDGLRSLVKSISKWIEKIKDWLKKFFPDIEPHRLKPGAGWFKAARILLYSLLAILVCLLAVISWRLFQRRKNTHVKALKESIVSVPDLSEDYIDADELPANRWLTMARELMQKKSLRLALRAFYLSTLAYLAENEMITIAKYKSNLDYVQELHRRAHEYKELLPFFSMNVKVFDRSWYGMHEVTGEDLDLFIKNQERIMSVVKS